jgi:hypothetical protein
MSSTIRWSFCVAAFFPLTLVAFNALGEADDQHPTAIEIAQLPRFCWGKLGVPDAKGPEFNIQSDDCGPAMNHYCIGLVDLIRAKRATSKGQRMPALGLADANIRYTERAMKDYPNCSLRGHVADSRAEVNHLLRMSGGKPIDAK